MTLVDLIEKLESSGVELWVEGDRLRYRGARDVLTPETLETLKENKQDILNLQRQRTRDHTLYPLSHGQRALWFLHELAPGSPANNVGFTGRVRSPLAIDSLTEAVRKLIARHGSLRTTFPRRGGQPVQCIHASQEALIEEIDASDWPESELAELVKQAYERPFNLETGPLTRVSCFTRSKTDHVLLLTVHHLACDAWSLWLLLEELGKLYQAERDGSTPKLPPLEASYKDYVRWQNQMLGGPEGERLWAYWRDELAGELPVLELPTDRPRPAVQTYNGASHTFKLSQELARRLQELTRSQGATLYTTILAAFQILLHRYTGQPEIILGSPTSGRSRREFAGIIGDFINTVVLRVSLEGDPTVKSLLEQARVGVLEALEHQDFPFSLLVERMRVRRDPSRSPLFQVLFNFQKPQQFQEVIELWVAGETGEPVQWGGMSLEPFAMAQQEGQFDLTLEMVEGQTTLFGVLKYNRDFFDESTIIRMEGHFQTLLEEMCRQPEQHISRLRLLTEPERRQLLVDWNDTRSDYPHDKCIHHLIEEQAKRTPEATAVTFEHQELTYSQLNLQADELANRLRGLGAGPNVTVGLCVERSLEMLVALLGILKSGAAYLPLDPGHPQKRLDFILKDAEAPWLVTQPALMHEYQMIAEAASTGSSGASKLIIRSLTGSAVREAHAPDDPQATGPQQLAYLIYTSGSTGQPKGVQIPHRAVVNFLTAMSREPGMTDRDTLLAVTTLSFDISVLELLLPLTVGGRVVIASREAAVDGQMLSDLIARSGATIVQATPANWRLLLDSGWQGQKGLKILCGGEALPPQLAEQLLSRCDSLWNMYGPTETTVWSAVKRVGDNQWISVGRPIANTEFYVLHGDQQPAPIGVFGELFIGGDGLAKGYWNRPELTRKAFVRHPFKSDSFALLYRTGDLVRYRPDGDLEFLRRVDHQVKLRGYRIELGEIETALSRNPAVREAVVLLREDRPGDQQLVAYFTPADGRPPAAGRLRQALKNELPEYMVPSIFFPLEEFPLNPNRKIDRKALPKPEPEQVAPEGSYVAPQTPTQEALAAVFAEVLNCERLGIDDNLFDLGGHSLTCVQLASKIIRRLSVRLDVSEFFKYPTVRELSQFIDSREVVPRWAVSSDRAAEAEQGVLKKRAGGFSFFPRRALSLGNEGLIGGMKNRFLQLVARFAPTRMRCTLHRWRGVTIGFPVLLGYDTIIETSYPWLVSIGDNSAIGMRVTIIGHFLGMQNTGRKEGKPTVEIGNQVWIGPGSLILPNVKIGDGSVVAAGSVVNAHVPPGTFVQGNPAVPVGKCGIPIVKGTAFEEFVRNLQPLEPGATPAGASGATILTFPPEQTGTP